MSEAVQTRPGALRQNFGWPPFTVLDLASAEWQARKRAWVSLGLRGEVGRGENLLGFSDQIKSGAYGNGKANVVTNDGEAEAEAQLNDTSIFDPVLTELVYTWFCPQDGAVLDPFAGGPTRGVIASKLGLEYHGHELRKEQVEANEHLANDILGMEERDRVVWYQGDSNETLDQWEDGSGPEGFDLVLTCPPYFNLEVYSEEDGDISNMDDYSEFLKLYGSILGKAAAKLAQDRFFAIVVGNVRGKANSGAYNPLVSDTIRLMQEHGLFFYNEAILRKPNGSAQFRARKQFNGSRKLVTCHETLLVFCKGDGKKATAACGSVNRFDVDDKVEDWI